MSHSCAEEHSCVEAASLLLMNEEGNMLKNDEWTIVKEIISDSDTRDGEKIVNRQLETLGSNANSKTSLVPDICHFIKCMANGFCTFKEKNSEFSGVCLLDANRIRAMSSNVSCHLKCNNKIDKII